MRQLKLFVSGPKFGKYFSSNMGGIAVDNTIFAYRLLDPSQRYSRSKSRVVRNRSHCWFQMWLVDQSSPRLFRRTWEGL